MMMMMNFDNDDDLRHLLNIDVLLYITLLSMSTKQSRELPLLGSQVLNRILESYIHSHTHCLEYKSIIGLS